MAMAKGKGKRQDGERAAIGEVPVDLHRCFVFPNRMREQRRAAGHLKLLRLASTIPEIPYIRLSKIERGEVVPRAEELRRIAAALNIAPAELLLDIDAPGFDIARWAEPFLDGAPPNLAEERFAVLLAAAVRARRIADPALTISAIEREYGLAPVNLSRIENAQKTFDRWNAATQHALYQLLRVADETELRKSVAALHASGALESFLSHIVSPAERHARSRARIAEVAAALQTGDAAPPTVAPLPVTGAVSIRLVPVLGAPLAQGLIADTPTPEKVEAPHAAGPRAFGLKVCRATLGGGLPGQAVVIVDPDRSPSPGSLAALREETGWRLLSVGSDRDGRMIGYSNNPELEIVLDDCDPARLAALVSAIFP
ncbi:helix-turn-helix domain-containing protein [Sphingomonas psychrotolerans]|uniref:Helix-turn-helix domain-containing protein n=1 Tax=Sphingomonas psychrotolerans TaxID=1327635 RepID=A0ABU3N1V9_9SPHN|nr:helix-turn-helix transcriptional regulator [Sphingomonas psychrotolerans]MDT8758517.1 helix-turn-helix domain-containing protein [Sphingomonas psychrotolerans]